MIRLGWMPQLQDMRKERHLWLELLYRLRDGQAHLHMRDEDAHRSIRLHLLSVTRVTAVIDGAIAAVDLVHQHAVETRRDGVVMMIAKINFDAKGLEVKFDRRCRAAAAGNALPGLVKPRDHRFAPGRHRLEQRIMLVVLMLMADENKVQVLS